MFRPHSGVVLFALGLVAAAAPALYADAWPRFRGPNGAGQADAVDVPSQWTAKDYNWKVELPGVGHSSPVVWDNLVFVTSGDPKTGDVLLFCVSTADGTIRWQKRFASGVYHLHARNSFASSTPAVDESSVYLPVVHENKFQLIAVDHAGEVVWQRDLGPFKSQHGFGVSPIVYNDSVIIANDQMGESFLIAVDRRTGETVWKTPRGSGKTAYSTPCVYRTSDGSDELIFNSEAGGICGVDPETGKINWQIHPFDKRSCSSPIVAAGLVFGSCGSGGGGNYVVAVRPGEKDGRSPEIVYKIARSAGYVPTCVAAGDLVFMIYDRGVATCFDAASGKIHWQKRLPGNFSGSPIRIGDRIVVLSDEGDAFVLAADTKFQILARNPLGDSSRSTPAVADGAVILRTYGSLISLGKR